MFLTNKDHRIQWTSFNTDGCINTRACANTVSNMVEGKTIEEAWKITPEKVINYLETLPQGLEHCAELTVGALYLALANYRELKRNPWRESYRRN